MVVVPPNTDDDDDCDQQTVIEGNRSLLKTVVEATGGEMIPVTVVF